MIVTQGGRFGGWGMLIIDGKPEFAYAYSNQPQHKYRVTSTTKLAPGKHTITFDFNTTARAGQERDRHALGGRQAGGAGQDRAHGPPRFSLDETLDVGEDTGTPVVEDYVDKMPFKFPGVLKKVVVELGTSGLAAGDPGEGGGSPQEVAAVRD